ncbi:helicase SNF [Paenibacillus selenitireducens]|uniref:Helicase SNF n=1 Tax=Paenibacillus selenitireducens TaxID=1324314 RepID=A0A1T2XHW7_9BACL|nr:DEAD/DEAH box helicase [Paenibacillus selenitireducens]OPA79253.1 helicase SNF [Paenibacillus selenitireducens]
MSFYLTERIIKLLCGTSAYDKGQADYQAGKVTLTHDDPDAFTYEAIVQGNTECKVTIEIDSNGDIGAECTCLAFYSYDTYCKHVAAALLHIHDQQERSWVAVGSADTTQHNAGSSAVTANRKPVISPIDKQMTERIMGLFTEKPRRSTSTRPIFDTRITLDVEFTCKPVPYGYRKYMFGLEMKVGPKRLYVVQKIRDVLEHIDRREPYVFSKNFSYDPELHSFQPAHDAIIQQLLHIYQHEKMYRETLHNFAARANRLQSDRMLLVPPFAWDQMLSLLASAPSVKLEHGHETYEGIALDDGPLPVQFEFDQSQPESYQLDVEGLEQILVMDMYGIILSNGKIMKQSTEQCRRLASLKQLLEASPKHNIQIAPEHMESFMERVTPGLMKLGAVHIAKTVSDRILRTPLKAKLYLDRVRDRLLAGIEFQYGEMTINPLEGHSQQHNHELILLRDGEKERRILELMEQGSFAKTEAGYFMEDEDGEYDFLYHIVPQLEKLMDVYATTSVKLRLYTDIMPPKITVNVDERTKWLEFQFDMDGIPESDIRNLLKSLEEKRKYHRLPSGALLPLETEEFQEIIRFMNEMGVTEEDFKNGELRLPVFRGLHLIDSHEQRNSVKLGKSFRRLLDNMRNPDNLEFPVPARLDPILRDYQKYGFQWFKTLAYYQFGGILADDMGLGKTLQSIAFIVSVLPEIREQGLPAIVVSPASLVYNWYNELQKFAPEIRVVIADGTKSERRSILQDVSQVDVVLTSYPLLRRDLEEYIAASFHTLILDEAQMFKNHATQTAQAVKSIQAQYRFALTGTPIENRLEELWSIFDAVFPDLFVGRRTFQDLPRATVARRARPFLLRRLKTDVLKELPEKIESIQASELLPDQKKLYVSYLAKLREETVRHLDAETFQKNRIKILAGLTRLRQLCCHPALFVEDYTGSSAKFEQLLEIIEECRSAGKRMLIFSQFTEMLGIIGRELSYQGVPHFYLDGNTPASERVTLCDRFNEGERDLFLMSLKAGGTGLNLTGADTVILYDLWWNPAVEQQAADRAHRIGQKRIVQVIRLVAHGTVEDKMYELQQRKKNLIDEIIQPGEEALTALTEQEIREILMIES